MMTSTTGISRFKTDNWSTHNTTMSTELHLSPSAKQPLPVCCQSVLWKRWAG